MSEPTYQIINRDCVTGMADLPEASMHLCVSSIPFGALFSYSGKTEDIGNNQDGIDMRAGQFGLHSRFMCEQLFRVLGKGAVACIHIQQLRTTIVQHGYMGRRDFRGAVIDIFGAAGFEWTAEVAIPKDPQVTAQRESLHSLQFKTGRERDSRVWAMNTNDYILVFRKPGDDNPVRCLYDAQKNPKGWVSAEEWIRWASGVWPDIRETDVVEGWKSVRDDDDEKHVCPLQLEVIRRCIKLYSNPGDTVFDPFMGVGSTAAVAIEQDRNVVGFELKESYFKKSLRVCELALTKLRQKQAPLPLFVGLDADVVTNGLAEAQLEPTRSLGVPLLSGTNGTAF